MVYEGDVVQDYTIIKKIGRGNQQTLFLVRCNVCQNEKILGGSNIEKQNMNHSARNCKDKYYAMFIGDIVGDYTIVDYVHNDGKYKLVLKCNYCNHTKTLHQSQIKDAKLKHGGVCCGEDYFKNEIGKIYGDYKITSFSHKNNGYVYFNIECIKCHTKGVKSLLALKRSLFKHGVECFKMLDAEYKTIFEQRFNNISQRCNNPNNTNYPYYGGKGIKLKYVYLIDFYLDYIDEFKRHVKIHGIKNTTFDRINVKGHYEKGNIRLTTQAIQSTNTTRKKYFILEKDGIRVLCDNAMEFGRMFNVNGRSIGNIVRGDSRAASGWELIKTSKELKNLESINVTTKLITT